MPYAVQVPEEPPASNGQINQAFLAATDAKTRTDVLEAVAKHYGISKQQALAELVNKDAEHLTEYLIEPIRSSVSVLMQRHRVVA